MGLDAPSEDLSAKIAARRASMARSGEIDVSVESRAATGGRPAMHIPEDVLEPDEESFDLAAEAKKAPSFEDAMSEALAEDGGISRSVQDTGLAPASKQVGAPAEVATRRRGRQKKAPEMVESTVVQNIDLGPVVDGLDKLNSNLITAFEALDTRLRSDSEGIDKTLIALGENDAVLQREVAQAAERVEGAVLLVAEGVAPVAPKLEEVAATVESLQRQIAYLVRREDEREAAEALKAARKARKPWPVRKWRNIKRRFAAFASAPE